MITSLNGGAAAVAAAASSEAMVMVSAGSLYAVAATTAMRTAFAIRFSFFACDIILKCEISLTSAARAVAGAGLPAWLSRAAASAEDAASSAANPAFMERKVRRNISAGARRGHFISGWRWDATGESSVGGADNMIVVVVVMVVVIPVAIPVPVAVERCRRSLGRRVDHGRLDLIDR